MTRGKAAGPSQSLYRQNIVNGAKKICRGAGAGGSCPAPGPKISLFLKLFFPYHFIIYYIKVGLDCPKKNRESGKKDLFFSKVPH